MGLSLDTRRGERREAQGHDEDQGNGQNGRIGGAQAGKGQGRERAGAIGLAMVGRAAVRLCIAGDDDLLGQLPDLRAGANLHRQHTVHSADHVTGGNQRLHAERGRNQQGSQGAAARKKGTDRVHCAAPHKTSRAACHERWSDNPSSAADLLPLVKGRGEPFVISHRSQEC